MVTEVLIRFVLAIRCQEDKVSAAKNYKYQITNTKQITMTETQNPKQYLQPLNQSTISEYSTCNLLFPVYPD